MMMTPAAVSASIGGVSAQSLTPENKPRLDTRSWTRVSDFFSSTYEKVSAASLNMAAFIGNAVNDSNFISISLRKIRSITVLAEHLSFSGLFHKCTSQFSRVEGVLDFAQIFADIHYFLSQKWREEGDIKVMARFGFTFADFAYGLKWLECCGCCNLAKAAETIGQFRPFALLPKCIAKVESISWIGQMPRLANVAAKMGEMKVFEWVTSLSLTSLAWRALMGAYALMAVHSLKVMVTTNNAFLQTASALDFLHYAGELALGALVFFELTNPVIIGTVGATALALTIGSFAYRFWNADKLADSTIDYPPQGQPKPGQTVSMLDSFKQGIASLAERASYIVNSIEPLEKSVKIFSFSTTVARELGAPIATSIDNANDEIKSFTDFVDVLKFARAAAEWCDVRKVMKNTYARIASKLSLLASGFFATLNWVDRTFHNCLKGISNIRVGNFPILKTVKDSLVIVASFFALYESSSKAPAIAAELKYTNRHALKWEARAQEVQAIKKGDQEVLEAVRQRMANKLAHLKATTEVSGKTARKCEKYQYMLALNNEEFARNHEAFIGFKNRFWSVSVTNAEKIAQRNNLGIANDVAKIAGISLAFVAVGAAISSGLLILTLGIIGVVGNVVAVRKLVFDEFDSKQEKLPTYSMPTKVARLEFNHTPVPTISKNALVAEAA